ncbi:MAG: hypothetical protein ABI186_08855 [Candidatus Elarobacter sp.]
MRAPEFVSLADVLLGAERPADAAAFDSLDDVRGQQDDRVPVSAGRTCASAPAKEKMGARDEPPEIIEDERAAFREARLFRARLADAFDDAFGRLLRELATEVLARELRIAPCDLVVLIERVAQRAPFVRLRVAAADAAHAYGLPAVADPALDPGDAVLELADGALDLRLGVRLAGVLEGFA